MLLKGGLVEGEDEGEGRGGVITYTVENPIAVCVLPAPAALVISLSPVIQLALHSFYSWIPLVSSLVFYGRLLIV